MFFSVDCTGLLANYTQCQNAKHICEIGVKIDEAIYGPNNQLLQATDCHIGSLDINYKTKWFRDVFSQLNTPVSPWISTNSFDPTITPTLNTDFNTTITNNNTVSATNLGAPDNFAQDNNGADYLRFRGYGDNQQIFTSDMSSSNGRYAQTNNSYYFYFGLEPGNTSLDRLNSRYFPTCEKVSKDNILIQSSSSPITGTTQNGGIVFSFIGGVYPIQYTIIGTVDVNGNAFSYSNSGIVTTTNDITINNLQAGTYLISGSDFNGIPVSDYVTVGITPPLTCTPAYVSNNPTGNTATGSITIPGVIGGVLPITWELTKAGFTTQSGFLTNPPLILNNLPIDVNNSYTVTLTDSSTPEISCVTTGLQILGYGTIIVTLVDKTDNYCYGGHNGQVHFTTVGGNQDYSVTISGLTGPNLDIEYSHLLQGSSNTTYNQLPSGVFSIVVTDSNGVVSNTINFTISTILPELKLQVNSTEFNHQCQHDKFKIPFKLTGGVAVGEPINLLISHNNTTWIEYSTQTYGAPVLHQANLDNIYVPNTWPTGNNNISLKYKYRANPNSGYCESNTISYTLDVTHLPTIGFDVYETPAQVATNTNNNANWATSNNVTVQVTNSYVANAYNIFGGTPYKIFYRIGGANGSWQQYDWPVAQYTFFITGNRNPANSQNLIEFYLVNQTNNCVSPIHTVTY
jgi:hypothetical protein